MASILGEIERKVEKLQAFMAQHCDQESDHSSVVEAGGTGGDWFFGIKNAHSVCDLQQGLGDKDWVVRVERAFSSNTVFLLLLLVSIRVVFIRNPRKHQKARLEIT